ncbi:MULTISPECIES: KpsF/GutQ family sugar-phosphate isomerase [Galbibacter]|uniref:KpsF/GutQ family sugar-phosphate isomerase n=1 Tax=Galbibacter pacificus TaxID=2996052 RepID=A0ABT6FPF6_9FLAO|nr:KpsF/GutQ family sugar-phosphate isomerase [Galbibacter pacificus]MDG3581559.1 KpsF/GutQ family sugar-phosphate isomerase [Galbibacter pacificus]MDG3585037.1 KpsF/GutQ family sugar-phosphate isomerase [Galbibacter pacificus]
MNTKSAIIANAIEAIDTESNAIKNLASFIDEEFADAVEYIYKSNGRVIITGVGKSAIIATKIVATFNSTGTPAVFMHAADAIHGDLGTILKDDVVICISKSGNTAEIKVLVPFIKEGPNKLIAITSNKNSFLGQQADFVVNAHVDKEACPLNLAPTTSTTAQLVIGDAMAICLLKLKGFSSEDFAKYHPGGALGKKLYLRVKDIATMNLKPQVSEDADVRDVIVEISEKLMGVTAVVNKNKIVGIVTDGDIRRMLRKYEHINGLKAKDIMSVNPKTVSCDILAVDALDVMDQYGISQLLVEKNGYYFGVIHIHDLIKEGII